MAVSILNGKSILAVDDEPDVLTLLEEEIEETCPDSRFDKASTYEDAVAKMISLTHSYEMGARAYLPKEKLGEVVPFLEDVVKYEYLSGWKRLLEKLEGFFNERWGQYWRKPEEKFWKEFDEKSAQIRK